LLELLFGYSYGLVMS